MDLTNRLKLVFALDPSVALASGSARAGLITLDLDASVLTPEQRALLALYTRTTPPSTWPHAVTQTTAALYLGARKDWGGHNAPCVQTTSIAGVLAACEAVEQAYAAQEAETAAKIAAELATLPDPADLTSSAWLNYASDTDEGRAWKAARETVIRTIAEERIVQLVKTRAHVGSDDNSFVRCAIEADSRYRQMRREIDEEHARREADAKEARVARRTAQIASCVREWGDESQRERLAEDALPQDEALDLIRERVFAPFVDLPVYQRIGAADLEHEDYCAADDDGDLTCEYEVTKALGRDAYARLQKIREAAKTAAGLVDAEPQIEVRLHTCTCDVCRTTTKRLSACMRIAWGDLTVKRMYALD